MPPRFSSHCFKLTASLIVSALLSPTLLAQTDAPPVNPAQLLEALHALRAQQNTQIKAQKGTYIQQVNAAAASAERAVALWEEAVRMTQFEGASHESTQFMAWKSGEGEAFKTREVQNALRLYFTWLGLTLQRSAGAKVKDMLPTVINYTKDLAADKLAIEAIEDAAKKEKDMNAGKPPARGPKLKSNDPNIKKTHDSILKRPMGGSVYVQWMKLSDWATVDGWENTPGSFDGIYKNIILPEMRAEKDPRLLDYWDMKLKKAADEANRSKLAFDVDKYNSLQMPAMLWGKASDRIILGQKNRALTDMFTLIKQYPAHPDTADWIAQLEGLLLPPVPAPAAADTAAPSPSPATQPPAAAPVNPGAASGAAPAPR